MLTPTPIEAADQRQARKDNQGLGLPGHLPPTLAEAHREISKWLNEEPNRPIDRQSLAVMCFAVDRLIEENAEPIERYETVEDAIRALHAYAAPQAQPPAEPR